MDSMHIFLHVLEDVIPTEPYMDTDMPAEPDPDAVMPAEPDPEAEPDP